MNIVYQLDDDSGATLEFRQANNDKRIDFVMKLIATLLSRQLEEVIEIVEGTSLADGFVGFSDEEWRVRRKYCLSSNQPLKRRRYEIRFARLSRKSPTAQSGNFRSPWKMAGA